MLHGKFAQLFIRIAASHGCRSIRTKLRLSKTYPQPLFDIMTKWFAKKCGMSQAVKPAAGVNTNSHPRGNSVAFRFGVIVCDGWLLPSALVLLRQWEFFFPKSITIV